MWNYEKRLQYPVNIKTPNAKLAQFIMSQYGGPDGEIGASMRYLSQRFTAPNRMAAAVLNDVATEELAHLEMVSTIVHQLTRNLSMEEIENSGLGPYYIDHTVGVWPQAAGGVPFNACEFQSKGDPITDLFEDLADEKAPFGMLADRFEKGQYGVKTAAGFYDYAGGKDAEKIKYRDRMFTKISKCLFNS